MRGLGSVDSEEHPREVARHGNEPSTPAIAVRAVGHRYGPREALRDVSFSVTRGELFGLLGPNGGGKSTLFRILATLLRPTTGRAMVCGHDVVGDAAAVRRRVGVVFQQPGLDPWLTVEENLRHHGRLYGLRGETLRTRMAALLERFGLTDRLRERVSRLSGGLARRVELAKGLLPQPDVLLLDEPSAGLDPGVRRELLGYLCQLRKAEGVTVVLTTHHMDEAERCDRVAVLGRGVVVALDAPEILKAAVGGDVVVIRTDAPAELQQRIGERFGCSSVLVDGTLRIEHPRGPELARDLMTAFGERISSVTFGRPTLEDAFVHMTGRQFADSMDGGAAR